MTVEQAMFEEMQRLEETLLHRDFRNEPTALEKWLASDFVEVGPQGRETSRAEVLQWLMQKDPAQRWQFSNWQVEQIAPAVRLVRYHAIRISPPSQSGGAVHCSLWCHDEALQRWRLRFHQSSSSR